MTDQSEQLFGEVVEVVEAAPVHASWSYFRRKVPTWACARSLRLLVEYNLQAGQRLGAFRHNGQPSEALKRITGAVLDHPDVDDVQWAEVVARTLAAPWWDGPPSVGCVFGPGVVDRNLAGPGTGKRLTSNGQLLRALREA